MNCWSFHEFDHRCPLISLCNALPEEWHKILKTNKNSICSKTHYLIQADFILRIEGKKVNLQSLKSKSLYDSFVSKISSIPAAQKKYNEAFSTHTSQLDWEKIYLLPFKTTLDTKLREFQYKILNRIFVQDFLPDCIYSGFCRLYSLRLQLSQTQYPEDYKDFEGFTSYNISLWLPIENNNI